MLKLNNEKVKKMFEVEVIKNQYDFYQIIPYDNIENLEKNIEVIIKGFSSMHRTFRERSIIKVFGKKEIQKPYNFSYEILISKNDVKFFYKLPKDYQPSIEVKMKAAWPKVQMYECDDPLNDMNLKASSFKRLYFRDYDFKSLLTNLTTNEPLPSILNVQSLLGDYEQILIQFIMMPLGRGWNDEARSKYDDYINGKLPKKQSKTEKFWAVADYIMNDIQYLTDSIIGVGSSEPIGEKDIRIKGDMTNKDKLNLKGFKTDIKIIAQTRDEKRREMLIHEVASAFNTLTKDNELIEELRATPIYIIPDKEDESKKSKRKTKKIKKQIKRNEMMLDEITKRRFKTDIVFSERELMQIMRLPEKSLQEKIAIDRAETNQIDIPEKFLNGQIRLARLWKKGKSTFITLPTDHKSACKPFVLIGPSGGGKTTTAQNMLLDITNFTTDGLCVFDYIKNNELSKYIINRMKDTSDVVVIDMTDIKNLPNLNICELDVTNLSQDEREENANIIYLIFKELIGQLKSDGTEDMTVRMEKYLGAACAVVFMHPDKSIIDVRDCLENYNIRKYYIDEALKFTEVYDKDSEDIKNLRELDKGNGTDTSKIAGILDRLNMFVNAYHMKKMIRSKRNLNFIDIMNEGKRIFFLMPDHKFINKKEVDVIVSCMLAKMWVAWKKRGVIKEPRIFHVFVDECHQIPSVCKALSEFMVEVRKYGGAFKFTCHDLDQLKLLEDAVKATGANYMITNGTEEAITKRIGLNAIEPFTPKDVFNFPEWTALLVLKSNNKATPIKASMMAEHKYGVKNII